MSESVRAAHPDPLWEEVAAFVDALPVARDRIVAPVEFGDYLAGTRPYLGTRRDAIEAIDAVVVHKGWVPQIDEGLLSAMLPALRPIFANPVFVVYGRPRLAPEVEGPHVEAFLAQLPEKVRATQVAPTNQTPFMVYLGNGRILCRDRDFRKFVAPSRASRLLAAIADGTDLVRLVRDRIAPVAASARRIVDCGSGCGFVLLAANAEAPQDAVFFALEDDPVLVGCLQTNIKLAGLYWRTELTPELTAPRNEYSKGRHKGDAWNPDTDCDLVHFDIGYTQTPRGADLADFLKSRRLPHVVLSHGLSARTAADAGEVFAAAAETLRALGYSVPEAPAFGAPGQPVGEDVVACARQMS